MAAGSWKGQEENQQQHVYIDILKDDAGLEVEDLRLAMVDRDLETSGNLW